MDEETIPLEAGIESRAISLTKGCYVGQEVIIRVLHRGHGRVARKLVGLDAATATSVPAPGAAVQCRRPRGRSTSRAARGRRRSERPIALAYVHRDFVAPGTRVSRRRRAARADAVRARSPFVRSRLAAQSAIESTPRRPAGTRSARELVARAPSASPGRAAAPARPRSSQRRKCSSTRRSGSRASSRTARRRRGVDAQLLAQLARHARGERFARLALAAGKLPVAREVHARLAPVTRNAAVALDDRGGDDDASFMRCGPGVNGIRRGSSSPSGRPGTSDCARRRPSRRSPSAPG